MQFKAIQALMVTMAMLLCTSCGYRIGFIKHPQIDALAVAPVINETTIYNVASNMRMAMSEVIMQDGTYKLSDQKIADGVLFLTVKQVDFAEFGSGSVEDNNRYRPSEWQTKVTVEFKLLIPGQAVPVRQGSVSGVVQFQSNIDLETLRLTSARQACYEAAKQVIYQIAEGW